MSQRVRVRYAKLGKIRWTSHRDTARMWERALRRAALPLAYSRGFSPRPRVSFGLALPTGCESVAEYVDLELDGPLAPAEVAALPGRLSAALPAGVDAMAAAAIGPAEPSLQQAVTSCTWRLQAVQGSAVAPTPTLAHLGDRVAALLAATSVLATRVRKGGEVTGDIRPAVLDLRVEPSAEGTPWLVAELACQPRSLRPAEVLAALDPSLELGQVRRLNQWISRDGARAEPLPAPPHGATAAPHAMGRAS